MEDSSIFRVGLTEALETISFTNMVPGHSATLIVQNSASGTSNFAVSFAKVTIAGSDDYGYYPGGEVPDNTLSNDAVDIYTFFCYTAEIIYVMVGGLHFGQHA